MSGMRGKDGYSAVLTLIIASVLVVATGATVTPVVANPSELGEPHPFTIPQSQTTSDANETPIRHEKPDEVERAGDLPEVENWLANRLSERLTRSSANLSEEQYAAAKELLGEQYSFHLERHQTVSEDTASESDDAASDSFQRAGETQQEFIDAVREYRETYDSFQEAQRLGDQRSLRRLGAQLEDQAEQVNETGRQLNQTYVELEVSSNRQFTQSRTVVETVVKDITDNQRQVRARFFTETKITASADRRGISFSRPLGVSGRLLTDNGTPIADQPVALQAGDVTRQARTDRDGRYRIVYRPVRLPLSTQNVTVAFEPGPESQYLESSTTVPVEVHQSTPAITIEEWPEQAAYRDQVEVRGTVTVDGTPVSGAPVVLTVGTHNLRETISGPTGFRVQGQLSLGVPPGRQPLRVQLPLENQAIAGASVENQIRIQTAPTTLRLRVTDAENGEVDVAGRLVAHDSIAIASMTIQFRIDDTVVGTVRTTQTGAYATTFSVPQRMLSDEAIPVTVTATFDPQGTNLEPATAQATTVVTPPSSEPIGAASSPGPFALLGARFGELSLIERVGIALGVGVLVGGLIVFRDGVWRLLTKGEVEISLNAFQTRMPGWAATPDESGVESVDAAGDADSGKGSVGSGESPGKATVLLGRAEQALREDAHDEAVTSAYAAVRGTFGPHLDVSASRTHWEFLADCGSNGFDEETMTALHELTVEYERAAFAAESANYEMATNAIQRAKQLTTRVDVSEAA